MMIVGGKWYICRVHWDSTLCRGAGTTRKKWEEGSLPQHANIIVGDSRCNTFTLHWQDYFLNIRSQIRLYQNTAINKQTAQVSGEAATGHPGADVLNFNFYSKNYFI